MREDVGKLRVLGGVNFLNIGHDYSERTVLQIIMIYYGILDRPEREHVTGKVP